jgi:small subunit ribosomal protein S4e
MGSMGGTRTLKRTLAPPAWPIVRKDKAWVIKGSPGAHSQEESVPALLVLRDMLAIVHSAHEARLIVQSGKLRVNGYRVSSIGFPVGPLDVVELPDRHYRLYPYRGSYTIREISADEATFRLLRIENKTVLAGGNVQLNLKGGFNLLLKDASQNYSTLDTLKVDLGGHEILERIPLVASSYVLVVKGKNSGLHGILSEVVPSLKRRRSLVRVSTQGGKTVETILDYVIAVGGKAPVITLPEVG